MISKTLGLLGKRNKGKREKVIFKEGTLLRSEIGTSSKKDSYFIVCRKETLSRSNIISAS